MVTWHKYFNNADLFKKGNFRIHKSLEIVPESDEDRLNSADKLGIGDISSYLVTC